MLSHFNSKATDGKTGEFIKTFTDKYGKDTLNQFAASAYDCVYAIFQAMKEADVDTILVGDSLGMTMQGYDTTLPVTMDDVAAQCGVDPGKP